MEGHAYNPLKYNQAPPLAFPKKKRGGGYQDLLDIFLTRLDSVGTRCCVKIDCVGIGD